MRPLLVGTRHAEEVAPGPEHIASAIGNPGVDVVSTPELIGFLETASLEVMKPYFEAGEASVGTEVAVRHRAAAHAGAPILCRAELIAAAGRRFRFRVEAEQGGSLVMAGEHERALIRLDRFLGAEPKAPYRPAPAPEAVQLDFWFDVHSPWCYLASLQIGDLARRHRARLDWRPLHLPKLIETIAGRRPLEESAAFVAWYRQDLADWAELLGVKVRYHPRFPLRNARALRIALYAAERGRAEAFVPRLLRFYWEEEGDIEDVAALGGLAGECGLDPHQAMEGATGGRYKAALDANTAAAIRRGVFGVPTIDVAGEKLFFGNDRLALLDRHLSRRSW